MQWIRTALAKPGVQLAPLEPEIAVASTRLPFEMHADPADRILVETDAPDQLPPVEHNRFPLAGADGRPLNHPANLAAVYEGLAACLGETTGALAAGS